MIDAPATPIQRVGVVGAGQMGSGIAQVLTLAGFDVVLNDIAAERLQRARADVSAGLDRQLRKGSITMTQGEQALARLATGGSLADLSGCDLVIEAATENEATKAEIFRSLAPHLGELSIVASNTSSISITRLAASSGRPGRFIGLHFMNPVPVMPLVEVIRGAATSTETFEAVRAVVARLGKVTALASDSPGFIVNRILIPMLNEAAFALYEGVGTVESIDAAMRLGTNQPMGPLLLADHIGLDTCLAVMRVLNSGFADPKYRPCPLLVRYVEAGWLGRKSGRGFYSHTGAAPIPAGP
ncbi:MAG: 3-hydroxybutyryl-CoA dehydrogenase [Devosia sp.]|nr:3-hydroxybutyryl-CoA dehydrogenase [Devosia sp.]